VREQRLKRPRRARRITLVALVDLVIILLIFFMLRTNFLQPRGMGVGTANQSQSEKPPPVPPLQVELHRDGSTWMAGRQMSDEELLQNAAQRQRGDKDLAIVAVDNGVKLQRAVNVIDILKSTGIAAVDLRRARSFDEPAAN
jgi:biopolymer transport protein ExbD